MQFYDLTLKEINLEEFSDNDLKKIYDFLKNSNFLKNLTLYDRNEFFNNIKNENLDFFELVNPISKMFPLNIISFISTQSEKEKIFLLNGVKIYSILPELQYSNIKPLNIKYKK